MKKRGVFLVLVFMMVFTISAAAVNFTDVRPDDYFAEAVDWAVQNGITSGTSATTFSPHDTCTRGQIITLLWRKAGSRDPANSITSDGILWSDLEVKDISPNDFFYQAVLWAKGNELFEGDTFQPNAPCTRLMAVEFMWKYAFSPAGYNNPARRNDPLLDTDVSGFSDVNSEAVDWAVARGIVSGTSATTFSPNQTCSRAEIVSLLYRDKPITLSNTYIREDGMFRLELSRKSDLEYAFYDVSNPNFCLLSGTAKGYGYTFTWEETSFYPYQDYVIVRITKEGLEQFSGKYRRQSGSAAPAQTNLKQPEKTEPGSSNGNGAKSGHFRAKNGAYIAVNVKNDVNTINFGFFDENGELQFAADAPLLSKESGNGNRIDTDEISVEFYDRYLTIVFKGPLADTLGSYAGTYTWEK